MGQPVTQIPGLTTRRILPQTNVCQTTEVFIPIEEGAGEFNTRRTRISRSRCRSWPSSSPCRTLTVSHAPHRAFTASHAPHRALLPTVSLYERQLKLNNARSPGVSSATRTTPPSARGSAGSGHRTQRWYQSINTDRSEAPHTPPSPNNALGTIGAEIIRKPNQCVQQNTLPRITATTCRLFDKSAKETVPPKCKDKLKEEKRVETKIRIEKLVISLPSYEGFSSPGKGFAVALTKDKFEPRTKARKIVKNVSYDLPHVQEHRVRYEELLE